MPPLPTRMRVSGAAIVGLFTLAGCDAQASTEYRGEPLLAVSGSVTLARTPSDAELGPALAFVNRDRGEFHIVDVEASGAFPAQMTMEIYQPPPDDAFAPLRDDGVGVEGALAYITAVTPEHPERIQFATSTVAGAGPTLCNDGPCECPASGCLRSSIELCTHDGDRCYSEVVTCPESNSPDEDCTVSYEEGDDSLTDSPWQTFAGVSENYVLLYLKDALAAGDAGGLAMGTRAALEPGYNLLAISPLAPEEESANSLCFDSARSEALERFNAQHHTDYSALEVAGVQCESADDCDHDVAAPEETGEYEALSKDVAIERGCLLATFKSERIADSADHPISIEIGDSFDPLSEDHLYDASMSAAAP